MKLLNILLILLLSTSCFTQELENTRHYDHIELENRLTLINLADSDFNFPYYKIVIFIKAGAYYQNADNRGIFHLIEHLKISSAKNDFPSFTVRVDGKTTQEYLTFSIEFLEKDVERGILFVKHILMNHDIPEKLLENEKKVIFAEYHTKFSFHNKRLFYKLRSIIWDEFSYQLERRRFLIILVPVRSNKPFGSISNLKTP